MQEIMTVNEVVKYLRLSKPTVLKYLQDGTIPSAKFGKEYRISLTELNKKFGGKI